MLEPYVYGMDYFSSVWRFMGHTVDAICSDLAVCLNVMCLASMVNQNSANTSQYKTMFIISHSTLELHIITVDENRQCTVSAAYLMSVAH